MKVKALAAVFHIDQFDEKSEKVIDYVQTYGRGGNWHAREKALEAVKYDSDLLDSEIYEVTIETVRVVKK